MKTPATARFVLVLLGLLSATPVAAGPSLETMRSTCQLGSDTQEPGGDYPGGLWKSGNSLTPLSLPGAVTVSAREAKCLTEKFGKDVVVLAAVNDERKLPNAHPIAWAASADDTGEVQKRLAAELKTLTEGDKTRPLLVYCHHVRCFLSYNVALRSVNAGYTSVFWMRPGLSGWASAGYSFAGAPPPPPVEQGLTQRYLARIKDCDEHFFDYEPEKYALHAEQFTSPTESDTSWAKDITEAQEWRRMCLSNVKREVVGNVPATADVEQRLARTDAEVAEQYRAARAEVEANPAKYFEGSLQVYSRSKLEETVELSRKMPTTAQRCGSFDYSMPRIDNSVVRARDARRKEYGKCLTEWREDDSFTLNEVEFKIATTLALSTRRFTCSERKAPHCISDDVWHEVGDIATPENLSIVQRADEIYSSRYTDVNDEIERLNAWLEEVNERIERYNNSQ